MGKRVAVEVIDGGTRESCAKSKYIPERDARAAEVKGSYDTEHILKNKFEAKGKDPHFRLMKGTSFYDACSDEDWDRIFKKRKVHTHGRNKVVS